MRTRICDTFGIEFPIFAFSHCRDVVAAVSRAGGFGVLGAVALSAEQLEVELAWIDAHVEGRPYGVDIVMPAASLTTDMGNLDQKALEAALEKMIPEGHRRFVDEILERYNVPKLPEDEAGNSGLLAWTDLAARSQVDVALAHPIRLLVNALGPPPRDVVEKAHARDVLVAALVGNVKHARAQVEVGVDVIVASGTEAGGHTGEVTTLVLVPEVVDAVKPTPVLAAGGIGCGRQAAAAMALGADGVWTGSIWLTVAESDTVPALREKLLSAGSRDTVRTRSLSGKPARLLRTPLTDAWDGPDSPGPLQMPLQFMLTMDATMRLHRYAHSKETGVDLLGSPVGQIVGRMNAVRSSRDVIYDMVNEYVDTITRMADALASAADDGESGGSS